MDGIKQDPCEIKKRVKPTERELTSALFELRMKEMGISCDDADQYTMGMIFDMITEKANDSAEWQTLATQEDIDAFLG